MTSSAVAAETPLSVRNVSRRFGGVVAVDDVSLDLLPGERRVILGPNGAGKTTLFNVIGGQDRPNSGKLYLFGRDVTNMSSHARAGLGLSRTFQITNVFPNLSVEENVLLAVQALQKSKQDALSPADCLRVSIEDDLRRQATRSGVRTRPAFLSSPRIQR